MKIAVIGVKGVGEAKGGIERHAEELYPRLVKRGHEVIIYCRPHFTPKGLKTYRGVKIKMLLSLDTKHLDAISHTFFASIDALFHKYDLIHYHAIGPALLSFIPKIKKVKTCVTVHALDWEREKWGRFAKITLKLGERAAAFFPHETIVVSKEIEKYYKLKYPSASIVYIPNGVNPPQLKEPNLISSTFGLEEKKYFLFAARLVPEKGCHYLVRAFKSLKTDMKLVIAGGSSHSDGYADDLKTLAADDSRIIFTGHLFGAPLEELYTNAYSYILPSDLEGLPVALLEALSYGLPTLCSDIPPHLEVAGNEKDGGYSLFFKQGDEKDLQQKLKILSKEHDMLCEQAKIAKEQILQEYNWEKITEATEKVYNSFM